MPLHHSISSARHVATVASMVMASLLSLATLHLLRCSLGILALEGGVQHCVAVFGAVAAVVPPVHIPTAGKLRSLPLLREKPGPRLARKQQPASPPTSARKATPSGGRKHTPSGEQQQHTVPYHPPSAPHPALEARLLRDWSLYVGIGRTTTTWLKTERKDERAQRDNAALDRYSVFLHHQPQTARRGGHAGPQNKN